MVFEIPQKVEIIINILEKAGYEAYAVGGCVRDALLGRTPNDWDITTSAKPEQVKALFHRTVDTGIAHGTVTVLLEKEGFEVTTYRVDGEYEDGRHPKEVTFTACLEEDLKRRDFTINAMAYSHETGIVDAFDGMGDLEKKVIRCVGCPRDRFTEDALRILRAIRFAAQLGFSIEGETYGAIREIAPNLKNVSKERIQVELTKLLTSAHPEKIAMVEDTGISPYVTGDFPLVFQTERERTAGGTSGPESFSCLALLPPEKSMRWAGFLRHMEPDMVRRILKGLKLDNETVDNGKAMAGAAQAPLGPEKPGIRRFLSRMTPYQFDGCLRLKALDKDPKTEEIRRLWEEIERDGDCVSLKELAVGGGDLLAAGMEGKEIGETLRRLLELVLEDPSLNRRELLLEKLRG